MNQKISSKSKKRQFQLLDEDSPQIRPSSPLPDQSIENLELEDSVASKIRVSSKSRRKKANARQTNLIKIKPIPNDESQPSVKKPSSSNLIEKSQIIEKEQSLEQVPENVQQKIETEKGDSGTESPVLYRMSDEQQISERKQQEIPQSSRRPLANSPTAEKKSDSDELESPIKLIRSPRKPRTKNQNFSRSKIVRGLNKKVQNLEQRQPTQVYEYQGNENEDSEQNSSKDGSPKEEEEQASSKVGQTNDFTGKNANKASEVIVFKSNSFYTLVNAEIPKSNFVNCLIKRKRGDEFFQKFVTYEFYLLEDKKYLMSCVKNRLFKTTSHFQFYRQKASTNKFHKDNLYACLDSNFTGTQFVLKTIQRDDTMSQRTTTIDKTYSHKFMDSMTVISDKLPNGKKMFSNQKSNANQNQQDIQVFEQKQVCFMAFKANFFGLAGQREVKLLKKTNKKVARSGNFSDLKTAQQNGQLDKFKELSSRKAILGKNGLELDFKGVAQIQSTKNIILENDASQEVLIFGKVKEDIYLVSIGNPLSIIQGLAFGIANLDRKFFVN